METLDEGSKAGDQKATNRASDHLSGTTSWNRAWTSWAWSSIRWLWCTSSVSSTVSWNLWLVKLKVGASNTSSVVQMDNERSVSEEGTTDVRGQGDKWVGVGIGELSTLRWDLAVLAAKVTNLTGLWLSVVACWDLAADEWVQVSQGGSAGTRAVDWGSVEVVACDVLVYVAFV